MSIFTAFRNINSYAIFVIIMLALIPIVFVIRNQIIEDQISRQSFENKLLETIAFSFNQSLTNDKIKNHNEGVFIHNQQVLVHNQQVLLYKGNFTVLNGIRNDTRTDFIPIPPMDDMK